MTSRAPPGAASGSSWAYPGTGGVGGIDVAAGQNGVAGLRYASEETVAELTKEEKVSLSCIDAREDFVVGLEQRLIPLLRALYLA
jgi:hypothetical protein